MPNACNAMPLVAFDLNGSDNVGGNVSCALFSLVRLSCLEPVYVGCGKRVDIKIYVRPFG